MNKCPVCGEPARYKYCSKECRLEANREYGREHWKNYAASYDRKAKYCKSCGIYHENQGKYCKDCLDHSVDEMCSCCGVRPVEPGLRKLCRPCYVTDGWPDDFFHPKGRDYH